MYIKEQLELYTYITWVTYELSCVYKALLILSCNNCSYYVMLLWSRIWCSVVNWIQSIALFNDKWWHCTWNIWLIQFDWFSTQFFFYFLLFWRCKNLSCLQKDEKAAVANQQNFPPKLTFPNPQSFTRYLNQTLVFMWNTALGEKFSFCFLGVFL